MKTYKFECYGRAKNAIGVFHGFTAERQAETEEQARIALYDQWEHIRVVSVTESEAQA